MKFFVYILKSELDGTLYIEQTSNLVERIKRHNKGLNRYTKTKIPWKIIYEEECSSRSESMKLEKRLKSWKKRVALLNYIHKKIGM
ncbi:GIY-YIG nuclease family protein [uncultured Draconibacterium sp.]|uniref:GIY-YIG nuclease family protein n=1 Tax=uncultured Draconibacterium sp. TaxID=1573823 RepID=UPI003748E32C